MVSTQGTRRPGSCISITELKMDCYLPLFVLQEYPEAHVVFARLAQYWGEHVGMFTMQRLDKAKSFNKKNPPTTEPPPRPDTQPLVPHSTTPWHTFYGRAPSVIESLINRQAVVMGAAPSPIETTVPPDDSSQQSALSQGTNDKPWTIDDVKHLAVLFKDWHQKDELSKRGITLALAARMPDLFAIALSLQQLVDAQLSELESLREAFRLSMEGMSEGIHIIRRSHSRCS